MAAGLIGTMRGWNLGDHLRSAAPLAAAVLMIEAIGVGLTAFAGLIENQRNGTFDQAEALHVMLLAALATSVGITTNSIGSGFGRSAPRDLLGLGVGVGQFFFAGMLSWITWNDPLDGLTNVVMLIVSGFCVLAGLSTLAKLRATNQEN